MDYRLDDYREAFLTAIQAMCSRQGIQMASEGHFEAMVTNCSGLARRVAQHLNQERQKHEPTKKPVPPVKL